MPNYSHIFLLSDNCHHRNIGIRSASFCLSDFLISLSDFSKEILSSLRGAFIAILRSKRYPESSGGGGGLRTCGVSI